MVQMKICLAHVSLTNYQLGVNKQPAEDDRRYYMRK